MWSVTDDELRAIVREVIIQRRSGEDAPPVGASSREHASHRLLPLSRGGDGEDGACLIEPAVRCNHCGYCLSYGH
jgi:hypothetical protein